VEDLRARPARAAAAPATLGPPFITLLGMANDLSRSQKTNRAYGLAVAGTASGVAAVVLLFVSGFGLFLVFAVIAVLCFLGFRRTVS
jgi:hypothetical protein